MAGLCGWFSNPAVGSDSASLLDRMAASLPRHHDREDKVVAGVHAALVLAISETAIVVANDDIVATIDGFPAWRDDALTRVAVNDGFAASLRSAWTQSGADALTRLTGSFALALHDKRRNESFLAVDNMGRRPLAYATTDDGAVLFASNATALRCAPGVADAIDPQGIYNYVYFHAVPSPGTIFSGIDKVPPGCVVRISEGQASTERFWQPQFGVRPRRPDGPLLPVVRSAVERCRTPAHTGCFLSGGLDSSTVAGVLNEQTDGPAQAFTIGFAQEGYDEIGFARIASKHFGLDLNDYYITAEDVANAFSEVARAYDEPFGNSSAVPTLICARLAASRGVTTLLAGDGGDELFAGNERYATQKLFGYYQVIPQWLRRRLLEPFFGRKAVRARDRGFQHKVRRYIEQANVPMPARTQTYNLLHTTAPGEVFSKDFMASVDTQAPLDALDAAYSYGDDATPLDRMLQMDWKFTLADNDLRKVSRMCDLAGVSVRYPLLDDEVIDHSIRVPSSAKLKRMELRHYYKESTRPFLPGEVINKSKHGFGLPFGEWLRKDDALRSLVGERVAALRQRNVFASDYLDQLVARHESDHAAYYGNFVWVLAMFEEWCQQHSISL